MLNKTTPSFLLLAALLAACQPASADIVATLPEYNGPFYDFSATYPIPLANIGDFMFTIPHGAAIVSATISGTFGNNDFSPDTALSDYYVDGTAIDVADCDDPSANCAQGPTPTAWSYTFTAADLKTLAPLFANGSIDFNVIQNSPFVVDTGVTRLDITLAPEPATFFMLGSALAGIALLRRRGKKVY